MKSKRHALVLAVVCSSLGVVTGGVIAHAATNPVPTPEINRANATIQLSGTLTAATCQGEDATKYLTYTGTWTGGERRFAPEATDYSLAGAVTVSHIAWTIDLATARGVLTGNISLVPPEGKSNQYSGKLILVTQGLPIAGHPPTVPARGWISAGFTQPDEGAASGDDNLIANVEFELGLNTANGRFGDNLSSLGYPDYSVVTNVAPTALDGIC